VISGRVDLHERFSGPGLDLDTWVPYYLPHWSSRADAAATWEITKEGLVLSIPHDQPLWCPDTHEEPLRVSAIQSACWSGPVGSPLGPQPFREGLQVREAQPTLWGYTPHYACIDVTMKASIGPSSMFAFWLAGLETRPEDSGEICVAEIFGSSVVHGNAGVGVGVHRFRDPGLDESFTTVPVAIDITRFHTYGVEWLPDGITFTVDGSEIHSIGQSPHYPMQLMIGVFDFPSRRDGDLHPSVPELVVSQVRGWPRG
jgi:hypothetical protein